MSVAPPTIPAAAAAARRFGNAPALIDNSGTWGFKHLYRDARSTASAFIASDIGPGDVIAWARTNMANYKVPRAIEFRTELPKNAAGKVLRKDLHSGEHV